MRFYDDSFIVPHIETETSFTGLIRRFDFIFLTIGLFTAIVVLNSHCVDIVRENVLIFGFPVRIANTDYLNYKNYE